MGIVKANAYGHGAVPVARALVAAGAPMLAVAIVEEGLELREAGIATPVLVLGAAFDDAYDTLVRNRLTPVVFTVEHVRRLSAAAREAGVRVNAHLKIDTGMGRIGVLPAELPALIEAFREAPELELEGVCTHFACADQGPRTATEEQLTRFEEATAALARAGYRARLHHLANSAGTVDFPAARQDLTRPGIMLYGYSPFDKAGPISPAAREIASKLERALTWRTSITHLKSVSAGTPVSYGGRWISKRTSRIATLPVGYGDGYPRRLSGRTGMGCADVLVRGRRAPVVGTICMDMMMADVTDVPGAALGDEVVLLGAQAGECVDADELASRLGTISYEILCNVGKRVPRRYLERKTRMPAASEI